MKPYAPERYFYRDAAHLLRRAGFGGTVAEIETYRKLGPEAAVERLLSSTDAVASNPMDWRVRFDGNNAGGPIRDLIAWWLYRMMHTQNPLLEKLTLFWHGHFATGRDKVNNAFALAAQNEQFRLKGRGLFEELALEVSRDPAMLRYLDNDKNVKGKPNENYARELFELFTMGVHGGYTEKDVQEAARAFTGWTHTHVSEANKHERKFVFAKDKHDTGNKTVLGQTGDWDGSDVVALACAHPATAKFITGKLWRFFVSETITASQAAALEAKWLETNGNIREVLRLIFTSEDFYAPENRYALIKSPVEYVIGTLKGTQAQLQPGHWLALGDQLGNMTQSLFYPPNVKGWDGGESWIADYTLLNRLGFIGALMAGNLPYAKSNPDEVPPKVTLELPAGRNARETIDLIGKTIMGDTPLGELRVALQAVQAEVITPDVANRMTHLALVSPQYHLA